MAAVNEGILPVPLAPKPIDVFVFVQVNVTPADGLVKLIAEIVAFEQAEIFPTVSTIGVGQFDDTQFDVAGCAQRLPTGVIVIDTFWPADKLLIVNVVVALLKEPVTDGPPFTEYE